MTGKIEKGIAGFYYVYCEDGNLYECKAKGSFRKDKIKPLVGDNVEINIIDQENKIGNIEKILPRKNSLIRPEVANVDQAMVIFAMANPMPNLNLLDRFLVMMEWQGVDTIICFSKQDIVSKEQEEEFLKIYEKCVNKVITFSNETQLGIDKIKDSLMGKTTVLAGPSGVGKSSLLNSLYPDAMSKTGGISEKIGRGKHTTRHSELFRIAKHTYLFDTPGFSSLQVPRVKKEELSSYFTEFTPYQGQCKFLGCTHLHEPNCVIKDALKEGIISDNRYNNYVKMYQELEEWEKKNQWR